MGDALMDPVVVFPDPPPPELARTLDLAGCAWKGASTADEAARVEPDNGWAGAVVVADTDPEAAWAFCRATSPRPGAGGYPSVKTNGIQIFCTAPMKS